MATSFQQATRELLHERLLDAADDLLRARPWASVTMADIARGAGVSRQTVYNAFASREGFARAYVLHRVERFLTEVERAVSANAEDPRAAVAAALGVFLTAAQDDPVVAAMASGEDDSGILAMITTDGAVLAIATERLGGFLAASWPQVSAPDARTVAETVVRLAISHAALPTLTAQETGAVVARLLGPFLDELVDG